MFTYAIKIPGQKVRFYTSETRPSLTMLQEIVDGRIEHSTITWHGRDVHVYVNEEGLIQNLDPSLRSIKPPGFYCEGFVGPVFFFGGSDRWGNEVGLNAYQVALVQDMCIKAGM